LRNETWFPAWLHYRLFTTVKKIKPQISY